MAIIIGVDPEGPNEDAMALGSLLARRLHATPILVHVYPTSFDFPSQAHVDIEWREYLRTGARTFLEECRSYMIDRLGWKNVQTTAVGHRSSGQGLAEFAGQHGARMIVIGSAPGAGDGRFAIGSTADKLLHTSPVPVATVPVGYQHEQFDGFDRLLVAFQNTPEDHSTITSAVYYAERLGLPLSLLTIILRQRMYGSALRSEAEAIVIEQLKDDILAGQDQARLRIPENIETESVIATGDSVGSALNRLAWSGEELLVVGSARGGPLRRVFLGDMTHRILQAAPVPCLIMTRKNYPATYEHAVHRSAD